MKNILFLILLLPLISIASKGNEDYFNQVQLSNNNEIASSSNIHQYYDTILSVSLDVMGISGIKISIDKVSPEADAQFGGQLYAHVKYYDGVYYLYIKDLSREKAIQTISHEVVHIHQYQTGYLTYSDDCMCASYGESTYYLDDVEYANRPWEEDAYKYESYVYNQVDKILR